MSQMPSDAARTSATSSLAAPPPAPLTSFIGREREVEKLLRLIEETRLLTLTGAGGSGKTRLAREVTSHVADVAWVELAPLTSAESFAGHVAASLGIREEATDATERALAAAFGARPILLVLDNCEHVIDACAHFAEHFLGRCPQLRILATSRESLGVAGERAWLVPALSVPAEHAVHTAGSLITSDAARLFVDRARDADARFELTDANAAAIAQICRRLDGLPLAIELAAARVRVLSPKKIAERLDDAFRLLTNAGRTAVPRHRALRETIKWSYDLLAEREQTLLRRLSVFVGGFSLEAAERVGASEAIDGDEVLNLIAALVDKSLVAMEAGEHEPRYRLLETVRQYAAEHFATDPDVAAVRDRHAAFYLAFVEEAELHVFIVDVDNAWLARIDADLGNIVAATDWVGAAADGADALLRFAAAIDWYAYARGRFDLSMRLIERALARRDEAPPRSVARVLMALQHHGVWTADTATANAAANDAIAIARTLDDRRLLALAIATVGGSSAVSGDASAARRALGEALAVADEDDLSTRIYVLGIRCYAEYRDGDAAASLATGEELRALLRRTRHEAAMPEAYPALGRAMLALDDVAGARQLFTEGIDITHRRGRLWAMVYMLEGMVAVRLAEGDAAKAARLLGMTRGVRERFGIASSPFFEEDARVVERVRARLDPTEYERLVAEGHAMETSAIIADATQGAASLTSVTASSQPTERVDVRLSAAKGSIIVRALGPLEIVRDGAAIPADAWRYSKPRELLIYLLCHPEGRTREQIGLVFWPDASSAQVKNSFHVIVHHLRKVLGSADVIALKGDRYRVAWELGVEFDAATFEREVTMALRTLTRAKDDAGALNALRSALALYRGEFLVEESAGDWHLQPRERLARLHADAVRALAQHHERVGEWEAAADAYRRIVLADSLDEEAYRGLMRALFRLGDRAQALRLFERLTALLRADLDAEPEPETVQLVESLRRGQPA